MILLWAGDWTGWFSDLCPITSYSKSLWILHCFLHNRSFLCLINTQLASEHSAQLQASRNSSLAAMPSENSHNFFLSPGMLLVSFSRIEAQALADITGKNQKLCLFKDWNTWISFLWHLVHLSQNRNWKNKIICSSKCMLVVRVKVLGQFRHFKGKRRQWNKCSVFLPPPYFPQKAPPNVF